nr:LysR substrate-binding domain-containing protein [Mesorhizobium sp. WSM4875]
MMDPMKRLPPTEQLLAFKSVVELGSFSAAAVSLNLSQSAVSHQISRLERRIGLRLLTRNAQGVALTDSGESYYAAIAEPLSRLIDSLGEFGEPLTLRRLSIQVESGFATAWLSPRLQQFVDANPGVQVEQRRASNLGLLDGVEIAIKWGSGSWPNCDAELLMSVDYTPICSPALAKGGSGIQDVRDLARYTLLHDRQYREWQKWLNLAGVTNVNARRGHVVDDTNILIEMAIDGQGVALCSPQLAKRAIQAGSLIMPFANIRLEVDEAYYLVIRKGAVLSPRVHAFATWIKGEAARDVVSQR